METYRKKGAAYEAEEGKKIMTLFVNKMKRMSCRMTYCAELGASISLTAKKANTANVSI